MHDTAALSEGGKAIDSDPASPVISASVRHRANPVITDGLSASIAAAAAALITARAAATRQVVTWRLMSGSSGHDEDGPQP